MGLPLIQGGVELIHGKVVLQCPLFQTHQLGEVVLAQCQQRVRLLKLALCPEVCNLPGGVCAELRLGAVHLETVLRRSIHNGVVLRLTDTALVPTGLGVEGLVVLGSGLIHINLIPLGLELVLGVLLRPLKLLDALLRGVVDLPGLLLLGGREPLVQVVLELSCVRLLRLWHLRGLLLAAVLGDELCQNILTGSAIVLPGTLGLLIPLGQGGVNRGPVSGSSRVNGILVVVSTAVL